MTRSHTRLARTILLGTSCLFTAAMLSAAQAGGLPTGGTVVSGGATITTPSSNSTVINQTTDRAILTWQDFSIGSGSSVTFNQPGTTSIALNRVLGSTPSIINGDLFANGHVWLINGNGVLFGSGAQVNVGSLIATTADMSNNNFMSGNYKFDSASANPNASIVNNGSIRAASHGSVTLAGPVVTNNGIIQADLGSVTLGGVSTFSVDFQGDNLLRFAVGMPVKQTPVDANGHPVKALVSNTGTISAKGGRVMMTTRAAESVVNNVINNSGMIEATSVAMKDGEVILDAGDGTVEDSGTVDVSGKNTGETGGSVTVEGKTIVVADGARFDASGNQGGGTVLIGGGAHGQGSVSHAQTTTVGHAAINADAIARGNGGTVVVWSDGQTKFAGIVSARGGAAGGNGGFVETSGHHLALSRTATVNTLAPLGQTGTWLLDPENIVVQLGGEDGLDGGVDDVGNNPDGTDFIDPETITNALATTDVTLEASNDISILNDLVYSSTHALNMLAEHSISVLADIQNRLATGGGGINLVAGWDGETQPGSALFADGAYGNGFGAVIVGGEGAPSASVGAASGVVTIAGPNVNIEAIAGGRTQIGFLGSGGGDINILATNNLNLASSGGTAHLGNGAMDGTVSGNITGDISINIGGSLTFDDGSCDCDAPVLGPDAPRLWIGNVAAGSAIESGNLSFIGDIADENLGGNFGFTDMIASALGDSSKAGSGGNVLIALPNTAIDLQNDIVYDSPHNLTILTTSGVTLESSVQNAGTGALTLIAGWDGETFDPAHLTDAGVYGNGFGNIGLGSEEGFDIAFGSKGGTTTFAGANITFDNPGGYTQIGYHGAGTGDINVFATGDLTLNGGETSKAFALIGNGSLDDDVTGNVSGDITATVGGLTTFAYGGRESIGGMAWLGNTTSGSGKASGNVMLTSGQVTSYGTDDVDFDPNTLGLIMVADLGTSADTGGNFTLALTDPNSSFLDEFIGPQALNYSSPHDLTILSTGSMTVAYSIQNAGTGAVSLLAGWDSEIAPADALTAEGGYGNNGAFIWVAGENGVLFDEDTGENHNVNSGDGTSVGSRGGVTTVGAAQIYVEGLTGYAQIGYHGSGGSGAINVIANGTPGDGGFTGIGACFDANANICVIGGRTDISDGEAPSYAQIGNLGMGVAGSSTANINVSATSNIAVSGGGTFDNSEDGGVSNAYGMIGSGDASKSTVQTVSGNISVLAGGQVNLFSSGAANSEAWIGNRTGLAGTQSGNLTLVAASMDDGTDNGRDLAAMFAEDLGISAQTGGGVTVGLTGAQGLILDAGVTYNSPHALSLLSTHNIFADASIQNSGSGDINLVAGWDGMTLDSAHFGDTGVFGNNNGIISIYGGSDRESPLAAIGSAHGTTNAWAGGLTLVGSGPGGNAQLGYYGAGDGNINVFTLGGPLVGAVDGGVAQIGNGDGTSSGNVGGDVSVRADGGMTITADDASRALIGNLGGNGASVSGNLSVHANTLQLIAGDNSLALIGNSANGASTGNTSGDIDVTASLMSMTGSGVGSLAQIGNSRAAGTIGGDTTITAGQLGLYSIGQDSAVRIGQGGGNAAITGDILVNVTNGLSLQAGMPESEDAGSAVIGSESDGGNSGDVTVNAGLISLASYAAGETRVGNSANTVSGTTTVTSQSDIALTANGDGSLALIAEQGGTVSGNVVVRALHGDISLDAEGDSSFAGIGSGAGTSASGNTTVEASTLELLASGNDSRAFVGSFGFGEGAVPLTGTITVNVANNLALEADGENAYAQIGNHTGGSSAINVTVGSLDLIGGDDSNGVAMIGNGAFDDGAGNVGGNISVNVRGLTTLSGNGGRNWIGNVAHGTALASGNLVLITGDTDDQTEGDSIADMAAADILNGDVTLGFTATEDTISPDRFISYNSSHTFNLLSNGDIAFTNTLSNSGSGAINVVAGWNGEMLDAAHFGDNGVFGNGGHGVTIGAAGDVQGDQSGVWVGSREGATSIYGDSLTLDATHGFAQLGYHGAGQGGLFVHVLGDVSLNGGASTGFYAQIGNGGRNTHGSQSGDITVQAGGDVTLSGGDGDESYAQIGHGGAGSNAQSEGYALGGLVTVSGDNVVLASGEGDAAYTQIGHGGFKAGNGLTGGSEINGAISVMALHNVTLTGNGNDAYSQIGHGGDQLNTNSGPNAHGAISGNILVQAPHGDGGSVTMMAGDGSNAYVQIGNGGYSINGPTQAIAANFTIGGNITVSDLSLNGGGPNGFAQIGNGDNSKTGYGNITGDIVIDLDGGTATLTNGPGPNANASIHNETGHGTVSGSITGFSDHGDINNNPETQGTIVTLINSPEPPLPITNPLPDVILTVEPPAAETETSGGANPIEEMSGGEGESQPSDAAAESVGNSLSGGKAAIGQVLLGGILKQTPIGGQQAKPHAIPKADEDYSSWGNEALWQ